MSTRPAQDHSIPIAVLALFLLNSPFTDWWTRLALPWYTIFLVWLAVIALIWLNQRAARVPDPLDGADDETHR